MPDELVLAALRNACHAALPAPQTVFHSDRGSQYASGDFRQAIGALEMVASMSRKGNCWDNAVAESFFATLTVRRRKSPPPTRPERRQSEALPTTSTGSITPFACTRHSVTCRRTSMRRESNRRQRP